MDVIDNSQQFSITAIVAPAEGFARISGLEYDTQATPGTSVEVYFFLHNDGEADVLMAKYQMITPSSPETEVWRGTVAAGGSQSIMFSFTMPNQDVTMELRTGHEA